MVKLSPQAMAVLQAIAHYWGANGVPPSLQQIGDRLSKTRTTIKYHTDRLEEAGLLTRRAKAAHTLQLTPWGWMVLGKPADYCPVCHRGG